MQDQTTPIPVQITASSTEPLDKTNIQAITGTNTQTPNRLIVTNKSYAAVALGYPDLQVSDFFYSKVFIAPLLLLCFFPSAA